MRKSAITELEERVEALEELLDVSEEKDDSWPEEEADSTIVPDSERDQGEGGFKCSHCGKAIHPGEEYYCSTITRESFGFEKGERVVRPINAIQTSTWCSDCYKEILSL